MYITLGEVLRLEIGSPVGLQGMPLPAGLCVELKRFRVSMKLDFCCLIPADKAAITNLCYPETSAPLLGGAGLCEYRADNEIHTEGWKYQR